MTKVIPLTGNDAIKAKTQTWIFAIMGLFQVIQGVANILEKGDSRDRR